MKKLCLCATHGHCFDGLASAALFGELISHLEPGVEMSYFAGGYGPGQPGPTLHGDINAILDFRYQVDPRLTYYFDHHATAFTDRTQQDDFDTKAKAQSDRYFWDPLSTSCTGLIARTAQSQFSLDLSKYEDLIDWADKIDGARFSSAEEATDRSDPRMQLVAVVERFGDAPFLRQALGVLHSEGLSGLSCSRLVQDYYRPMGRQFREYTKRVKQCGKLIGRVAYIDLTDKPVSVVTKFSQYREFPEATYSIIVSTTASGVKISLGFNPWSGNALDANLGALCAHYGGGGHPVVGAVSRPLDQAAQAHSIANTLLAELNSAPQLRTE